MGYTFYSLQSAKCILDSHLTSKAPGTGRSPRPRSNSAAPSSWKGQISTWRCRGRCAARFHNEVFEIPKRKVVFDGKQI